MHANRRSLAFFIPSYAGGGAERSILNLSAEIARRGIPTSIVSMIEEGPLLDLVAPNVGTFSLGVGSPRKAVVPLSKWLKQHDPAILFATPAHLGWAASAAGALASMRERCWIGEVSTRTIDLQQLPLVPRLARELLDLAFCRRLPHIAVSEGGCRDLEKSLWRRRGSFRYIYNPVVDEALMDHRRRRLSEPAREPGRPLRLVAVGRLEYQKGFDVLVRSAALLRNRLDFGLRILGEGSERPALERMIEENGLQENVTLDGFVADRFSVMREADVMVSSSRWEGLHNALIEALAIGLPIVSTDCPNGPREVLAQGLHGRLVPVDDPVELARSIEESALRKTDPAPLEWIAQFSTGFAASKYLQLLLGIPDDRQEAST